MWIFNVAIIKDDSMSTIYGFLMSCIIHFRELLSEFDLDGDNCPVIVGSALNALSDPEVSHVIYICPILPLNG